MADNPSVIAFYLPQYHPIPENDDAWGVGFTEWNNVVKSQPRFKGHYQPHIPRELGFYDLRLEETRSKQFEMALEYGVDAFCFYSYWLNNKVVLGLPLELELKAVNRDFPICLCWANENWTRAWDGREADLIMRQDYDLNELMRYFEYLVSVFKNPRYLRKDKSPIFLVYSPEEIPPALNFPALIRTFAKKSGINSLHLIAVKHGRAERPSSYYISNGYDEVVLFQPNKQDFPSSEGLGSKFKEFARKITPQSLFNVIRSRFTSYQSISYKRLALELARRELADFEIPCVFPSWDNTARRSISTVIENNDPEIFRDWLKQEILKKKKQNNGFNAVFINAWNEWAEGCHLEPDQRNGLIFLEAVKSAIKGDR
ncbi:MAG: glycoside hydrolase family 99-like domain-containing protein [Moraxella osloensis]|nr:glycoside hydrolase family 99-like domain-containing protein [Moraxella osloensis]